MKIILVALYRYQNFPVRIMHAILENIKGIEPHVVFFKNSESNAIKSPSSKEKELFIKVIKELNPKLVGFSVLSPFVPIAKELTKLVKKNTSALTMWGGIHPTISPEDFREVDIFCRGEGEIAITELVKCLRDNKPYGTIRNLWPNSIRPLIQDLDSLPYPAYKRKSFYFIDSNRLTHQEPRSNYYWILASRGCHYRCSFCANSILAPLLKDLGSYNRIRSVDNVIEEIKQNMNKKTSYVIFVDEGFAKDILWLRRFASRYKTEIGLPFHVEYNPNNLNSEVLAQLVYAGVEAIDFGIQTGSDYIRNHIFQRAGKNSDILKLAYEINKYKIRIRYDLILNNPYDTKETLKETINLLLQLPKPLFFNLFSLQYFPKYPLTKKLLEDKLIGPEEITTQNLSEKIAKNWNFVPKLSFVPKQKLQNLIWLIANNYTSNNVVKCALSNQFILNYLNLQAIILSRIEFIWKNPKSAYLLNGFKYILKGNFKVLFLKIKKHLGR